MADVAVIGAGISGMTAAAVLAGQGLSVTLVEKAPSLGPLVGGFARGALPCDTGFHLAGGLAEGGALRRFLRFAGVEPHLTVLEPPPGGSILVRCLSPALDLVLPEGEEAMRDRLATAFPAEAPAVDAFLAAITALYGTLPFIDLSGPLNQQRFIGGAGGPSLQEKLDDVTGDHLLQGILSSPSFLYGVPPGEAPMAIHAGVAGSYYGSARAVAGGGAAIIKAFGETLARRGVDVRLGAGAAAVIAGAGGVEGIRLDGGEVVPCSFAIATIHPRLALQLAPEGAFRPVRAEHLANLHESMTACVLHAECGGWRDAFGRRNLVLMPTPDCFASPTGGPVASRPLYLAPTPTRTADENPAGFTVIVPVDPGETAPWSASRPGRRPAAYRAYKEAVALASAERLRDALPELDGRFRFVDVATPLTYRDLAHSATGSLYGVAHTVGQINPLPVTRTRGFLLAGQAVVAPGIMGAMISAFMACGPILGPDEVRGLLEGTA